MKILLVCAGGISSSVVMKRVSQYGMEVGEEIVIDAVGVPDIEDIWENYDCVLTAPQVRNRFTEIKETARIPIAAITPQDYATGNAVNIVKLAKSLIDK